MDTILSVTVMPVVRDPKATYPDHTYRVESRDDVQFDPETGVLKIRVAERTSRVSGRWYGPQETTYPKGGFVKFTIHEVERREM